MSGCEVLEELAGVRGLPGGFIGLQCSTALRAFGFGGAARGDLFRLLVLHLPDAAVVVVAVGADGSVGWAVGGAAGVIVNDGLIAEIDDIQRAIGTDADFDGAEPETLAADELGLLAARLAVGFERDAGGLDHEVADDVQRGLGGEVAVVPLRRPGAAFIDGATGGGGVAADLVDLDVSLLLPMHGRIGGLFRQHAVRADNARQFALGQHILRQDNMDEMIATGGHGVEDLTIGRDVEAPGVAAA